MRNVYHFYKTKNEWNVTTESSHFEISVKNDYDKKVVYQYIDKPTKKVFHM